MADLRLDGCQQTGSAEGTEAAKGPSAWGLKHPGVRFKA